MKPRTKKQVDRSPTPVLAGVLALALINGAAVVFPRWSEIGLGLASHDEDLARFLEANRISGKVFNSFASGGYLIHYFPDQRVYIDNRPEAYPGDFIRDEYLRPIDDEEAWRHIMAHYDFDYICFARVNQDEGKFLLRRIRDPEWAAVFTGSQMVLVRRSPRFAEIIARHEVKF